jgi:hypothetical protein
MAAARCPVCFHWTADSMCAACGAIVDPDLGLEERDTCRDCSGTPHDAHSCDIDPFPESYNEAGVSRQEDV